MNALRIAQQIGRSHGITPLVIFSYAFDWALLAVGAGVGYVLGEITPNKRPFSLDDRDIAFPHLPDDTIPGWLLLFCSALIPILVIALLSLTLTPSGHIHTGSSGTRKSSIWKHKLWELHAGWIGLALSLISTWIITNSLKNMYGKPRPDLLSRCRPDLDNVEEYLVGGRGSTGGLMLVTAEICMNADAGTMDDGFRAYPSGHASLSAAGLVYLTLFLLSKLAITTPFLVFTIPGMPSQGSHPTQTQTEQNPLNQNLSHPTLPTHNPPAGTGTVPGIDTTNPSEKTKLPNPSPSHPQPPPSLTQGHAHAHAYPNSRLSAPPLYLLLISLVPFFAAIFIGSTRWFDYRHRGVDIVSGLLIGTATSLFSFYYYHSPITCGHGKAWGPRRDGKAFWSAGRDGAGVRTQADREINGGVDAGRIV